MFPDLGQVPLAPRRGYVLVVGFKQPGFPLRKLSRFSISEGFPLYTFEQGDRHCESVGFRLGLALARSHEDFCLLPYDFFEFDPGFAPVMGDISGFPSP